MKLDITICPRAFTSRSFGWALSQPSVMREMIPKCLPLPQLYELCCLVIFNKLLLITMHNLTSIDLKHVETLEKVMNLSNLTYENHDQFGTSHLTERKFASVHFKPLRCTFLFCGRFMKVRLFC